MQCYITSQTIGRMLDIDLINFMTRYTEFSRNTALLFPPLGPIYLKSAIIQAKLCNLAVFVVGKGYSTSIVVTRKSYLRHYNKKKCYYASMAHEELDAIANRLQRTIKFIKRTESDDDASLIEKLPILPSYLSMDRNVVFENDSQPPNLNAFPLVNRYAQDGHYSASSDENVEESLYVDNYTKMYAIPSMLKMRDIDLYGQNITGEFVGGNFFVYADMIYERYLCKIYSDILDVLGPDFEIVKPVNNYSLYLSYSSQLLPHVIEMKGVDARCTKREIGRMFNSVQKKRLTVVFCGEGHCLVVFATALRAYYALQLSFPNVSMTQLKDGSPLAALIACRFDFHRKFRFPPLN